MANVETQHPDYIDRINEWRMMRHVERGTSAVKGQRLKYLPMPDGFMAQEDGGVAMYSAYMHRAEFPEIINPTVMGMVGLIHKKEPKIDLPPSMMPIWERATKDKLSLEAFFRRITAEVFLMGRFAVLPDAASAENGGSDVPWLAGYSAESLINWSAERDFFVLNESGRKRDDFLWEDFKRYRVLELRDGQYVQVVYENDLNAGNTIYPRARGDKPLTEIPLVVVSPVDLAVDPYESPLIGMARSALTMYRLDADYKHQLFMTGQETLFISGVEDKTQMPTFVGAGVTIGLPPGAKAEYVGPRGVGIEAHRQALEDERKNAVSAGAKLFDDYQPDRESGKAKTIRYAFQTATLSSISIASASGLEAALRHVAVYMGEDPSKVIVKPNLQFFDSNLTAQDVTQLVDGWLKGAFSYQTLYENLERGGVASEERSFEDEKKLVDAEVAKREEAARQLAAASAPTPGQSLPPRVGGQ
jgi:hypothetical protein